MKLPDGASLPWWYLSTRSTILNNLCFVLGGHLNKEILSPLTALKRCEITNEALAGADKFLQNCLAECAGPGNAGQEARYDFFLASHVLYHRQKELGIKLIERDEQGFQKELERYRQALEKIIKYDPDAEQCFTEDEVLHLIKCFNALANHIYLITSAHHRLLMTHGRSK